MNFQKVIGKSVAVAMQELKAENGYRVRVVKVDGSNVMKTMDYDPYRINVGIKTNAEQAVSAADLEDQIITEYLGRG